MKERIVIDEDFYVKHFQEREIEFQEEDMCSGGNPEEWWHYKKEQVPETFEELKGLCRNVKEVSITEEGHINVDLVYFTKDGEIYIYIEGVLTSSIYLPITENRTPQQMWQIIKSLIGEE